jgi:hypothetical protein
MNACTSSGGARKPRPPPRAANQCHAENGMKTEVVDEENENVRKINDRICCGGADGSRDPSWHPRGLDRRPREANRFVSKLRRFGTEVVMEATDPIRVLVVSEKSQAPFAYHQLVDRNDCQCHFARSQQEVAELTDLRKFDIVLSTIRVPGGSAHGLVDLLSGSRACVFYSLCVEEGHWWLPALRFGKDCFGTAALRGNEFVHVLDQLVKRIRANITAPISQ